jgi:hypothetical protein
MNEPENGYYFCLDHQAVERHDGCADKDRLGPFDTTEAAAHALATLASRQARYDREDEADEQ